MKKLIIICISILFSSCSTYNVENEINKSSVSKYKNSAIIFRLPKNSSVSRQEIEKNFISWLEGFKKNNTLLIPDNVSDKIRFYDSDADRFYQVSEDNVFLLEKSSGSLSVFNRENEKELKNIINGNGLDSIIIYEIDGFCSATIQYLSFSSMIVILDADGKISYLDHQSDAYDTEEITPFNSKIKMNLLDKIAERLIEQLLDLDYIEKN